MQTKKDAAPIDVLVAEDDSDTRGSLVANLRASGYNPFPAENGIQAINFMAEMLPSGVPRGKTLPLVVTDVVMPGAGGEQVLRAAKSYDPEIPVIVLSGLTGPRDSARITAGGRLVYYLNKPALPEDMVEAANRMTTRKISVPREVVVLRYGGSGIDEILSKYGTEALVRFANLARELQFEHGKQVIMFPGGGPLTQFWKDAQMALPMMQGSSRSPEVYDRNLRTNCDLLVEVLGGHNFAHFLDGARIADPYYSLDPFFGQNADNKIIVMHRVHRFPLLNLDTIVDQNSPTFPNGSVKDSDMNNMAILKVLEHTVDNTLVPISYIVYFKWTDHLYPDDPLKLFNRVTGKWEVTDKDRQHFVPIRQIYAGQLKDTHDISREGVDAQGEKMGKHFMEDSALAYIDKELGPLGIHGVFYLHPAPYFMHQDSDGKIGKGNHVLTLRPIPRINGKEMDQTEYVRQNLMSIVRREPRILPVIIPTPSANYREKAA